MMFTFKRSLFCALTAVMAAGSAFAAQEPLRVGTEPTFAPFEFRNAKTGEYEGFEMDLCREIGKRLGREIIFEQHKFDAILPAVMSGMVDFSAAGFAVTEERKKKVAFTTPHHVAGITIIVPRGNKLGIKDFDDLKGKRISVQLGSISHDKAKTIEGAKVTTFDSAPEAFMDLAAGNADAVINSNAATDYMLLVKPTMAKQLERLPVLASQSMMAMVVSKKNPELLADLNKAIESIKADGTLTKLQEKWFGHAEKVD